MLNPWCIKVKLVQTFFFLCLITTTDCWLCWPQALKHRLISGYVSRQKNTAMVQQRPRGEYIQHVTIPGIQAESSMNAFWTKKPNSSQQLSAAVGAAQLCEKHRRKTEKWEKFFNSLFFLPLYKVTAFKSRGRFGATGVGRRTAIRAAIIESRDCEAVQFQQEDDVWDFFSPSRQMIASLSLARMNVASSARLRPPPPFLAASSAASRNYRVGLTATLMAAYSRRLLSLAVPEEAASFSGPSARIMGAKPE